MTDKRIAVQALRVVAALSEKLADDLDNGRLWEGEYGNVVSQIQSALSDAEKVRVQ